jgi:adenylate cyclase
MPSVRRLTTVLADVAGYSRLMNIDDEGTHERLRAHPRELIDPRSLSITAGSSRTLTAGSWRSFASVVK